MAALKARRAAWRLTAARLLLLGALAGSAAAASRLPPDPPASPAGAALYVEGVLGDGSPLSATREGAPPLQGKAAACVNCHRRSGLGSVEGRAVIPPVTGAFLFHAPPGEALEDSLPYVPGARLDRESYTEESLARAIREGVDSRGMPMSYLMPRYPLGEADLRALIAHLRALDKRHEPGVTATELHFATILTPEVPRATREAVVNVIRQFFEERNGAQRGPGAQVMSTSGRNAFVKKMFRVNRQWVLHVWEVTGPPSGWAAQLAALAAAQPVFAVLSGAGGRNWGTVQDFCEHNAIPCLFPNVALPPEDAEGNFHTLYFSRGVRLEADLIAQHLAPPGAAASVRRLVQVYRRDDVGMDAARELARQARAAGIAVEARELPASAGAPALRAAVAHLSAQDALVLWLRDADLGVLPASAPAQAKVYLSGRMAGYERTALAPAWRAVALMAYGVDLPDLRRVRVDYALGWFRIRHIEVVDEPVQADTFLACGILSETIKHMVDAFVPDYLVERIEDTLEHRIVTGFYPRLTLAPTQRFASKGGYLVHLDAEHPWQVHPVGEWIVP